MTISVTSTYTRASGNGVTTVFSFAFKVFSASDLVVTDFLDATGVGTVKTLTTDYSVALSQTGEGGTVTFVTPPAAAHTVDIRSRIPLQQPTSMRNQGPFHPEIHESAFDRVERQVQDLARRVDSSFRISDDQAAGLAVLAGTTARAGKYTAFDANGDPAVSAGTGNDSSLRTDLASSVQGTSGDRLIGVRYDATGSAGLALHDYIEDDGSYNLMGFIPQNLKAAIRNRSGLTDLRAYVITALDAAKAAEVGLMAPRGLYTIDGTLTRTGYVNFFGARGGSQAGRCTTLNVVHATGSLISATAGEFETFHISDFDIIGGGGDGSPCFLLSRPQAVLERINMDSSIGYNNPGIKFLDNGTLTTSFGAMLRDIKWVGPYTGASTPVACNYRGLDLFINGGSIGVENFVAIFGSVGVEVRQGQAISFKHLQCNRQTAASSTDTAATGQAGVRLSGALSGGGLVNYKENISFKDSYIEACTRHYWIESCEGLSIDDGIIQDIGFGTQAAIEFVGTNVQNAEVSNTKFDMTLAGAIGIKNASPNGVKESNNHYNLPGVGAKYISTTTRIDYESATDRVIAGTLDDPNKLAYDMSQTEAPWTPTIAGTGTAGTNTYALQEARWKRHGRKVDFWGVCILATKDAALAGNLVIRGLPFTSRDNVSRLYTGSVSSYTNLALTAGYNQVGLVNSDNSSDISLFQSGSGAAVALAALTNVTLQGTSAIYFSGSMEI
jgi:hypothetical protein